MISRTSRTILGESTCTKYSGGVEIVQWKLNYNQEGDSSGGGEGKSKVIYMVGCALILHHFSFITSLHLGHLIGIVSPLIFKWDAIS